MKRFTATIVDAKNPKNEIEVLADDPGQLLRKLQEKIGDTYRREMQDDQQQREKR